jgi:hypothetical protein
LTNRGETTIDKQRRNLKIKKRGQTEARSTINKQRGENQKRRTNRGTKSTIDKQRGEMQRKERINRGKIHKNGLWFTIQSFNI